MKWGIFITKLLIAPNNINDVDELLINADAILLGIKEMSVNYAEIDIKELDRFVKWYDSFRTSIENDEPDFHIAATVASGFLQAAY